jgi:hypothetical protein
VGWGGVPCVVGGGGGGGGGCGECDGGVGGEGRDGYGFWRLCMCLWYLIYACAWQHMRQSLHAYLVHHLSDTHKRLLGPERGL